MNLEDNLFELHDKLSAGTYQHSKYKSFFIQDPKLRHIHKAAVVDRLLHHAVMRVIEPIFERGFIFDSYSSRKNKGTHKAVQRLREFAWKLSRNNTKTVWVVQCDIRKFFDSVDHDILKKMVFAKVRDEKAQKLISYIIESFHVKQGQGMPLGNVTSQLFSNIYLNPLDQFIKRELKSHCYVRYADDFAILGCDKNHLENLIPKIGLFLHEKLLLQLHPNKIQMRKWSQGIDFLGYVSFPRYTIMRTKTKHRMLRKIGERRDNLRTGVIGEQTFNQSLQSYLGILIHCRSHGVKKKINVILCSLGQA